MVNITEDKDSKPIKFIKDFCYFDSPFDVYVLMGVARKKYNPLTNSQEVVFREVIKKEEDIVRKYNKLIATCKNYKDDLGRSFNYYIYLTVNPRCSKKAFALMQKNMIDWAYEMMNGVDVSNKLKRIDNQWISSLMKPSSRSGRKYFQVDLDTKDNHEKIIEDFKKFTEITHIIETRNGYHLIVKPFNRTLMDDSEYKQYFEINTDSLCFIEFISNDQAPDKVYIGAPSI